MTDWTTVDAYGVLTEPATLKIERLLPGPIERVWAYLAESDLRGQWLASGEMTPGQKFELTWRNDDFTDEAGERPEGIPEVHSMPSEVIEFEPPHKLTIAWRNTGDVSFELEKRGDEVLLTLTHRRFPDRSSLIKHAAGWHAHLDVLVARATGQRPRPFWDAWSALVREYEARIPE